MSRTAKGPWKNKQKKKWYCTIKGRKIPLDVDEQKAWIKWHDLMGETKAAPEKSISIDDGAYTVEMLIEVYLRHVQQNRAASTFKNKRYQLNQFLSDNPNHAVRLAEKLKPVHLTDWVNRKPEWDDTYRHTLISAVQIAYNWAFKQGMISVDNIRGMEKPTPRKKAHDEYWAREDYEKIVNALDQDDPLRDFISFLWETGTRPGEAAKVTVEMIDFKRKTVVMPNLKPRGPKIRVITLNKTALDLVKKQDRESGVVFLNSLGNPWNKDNVGSRLRRMAKTLGTKTKPGESRHGFATDMLSSGVDVATVSTLMGHTSTRMVSSTYSHLIDKQDHLQDALKQRSKGTKKKKRKPQKK